jgi:hypothetical protein
VTTALVNPLVPSVLNPAAGSNFGNLGFMRPQLRWERFLQISPTLRWTPQFALSSPVGTDFFQQLNVTDQGAQLGEENGWPNVESRWGTAIGQKMEGDRFAPLEFGVSGAVGELRLTRSDFQSPAERFTTLVWMYGLDWRWQMTQWFAIAAEGYYGNALGSYAAGNKQSFNLEIGEGVRATGGFVELQYKPLPKWIFHAGCMIDDPLDRDVSLAGRVRQQNIYSNVMYLQMNLRLTAEHSRGSTQTAPNRAEILAIEAGGNFLMRGSPCHSLGCDGRDRSLFESDSVMGRQRIPLAVGTTGVEFEACKSWKARCL